MAHHVLRILVAVLALLLGGLALTGQLREHTLVEQVQADGALIVVTRLGPTTLYETDEGPAGMDYDLARSFARSLDVDLRLIIAESKTEMYRVLAARRAHLAAGALTLADERREHFRFSTPYAEVDQHLVYRRGEPYPETPEEFAQATDTTVRVAASSQSADRLRALARDGLPTGWEVTTNTNTRELLYEVWTKALDFTIVDSNELAVNQSYYPELRVAFTFKQPQQLAWAFRRESDDSLYHAAERFLDGARDDGTLTEIRERYYGHLGGFDYVGARTFLRHVTERLPRFRELFVQAGEDYQVDWRLLAAMAYQESHWDPDAVSPTGVRGLMMLTRRTAAELGLDNRVVPEQSITGGARYFSSLRQRLPDDIEEPDRTWLALAAYNVGMGHLEDARAIAESQGYDPNRWADVREHLPLLAQPDWHEHTEYGFARGQEPVQYVRGIRGYYTLLTRITDPGRFRLDPDASPDDRRSLMARDTGLVRLPQVLEAMQ